jgi:hypothetical protein
MTDDGDRHLSPLQKILFTAAHSHGDRFFFAFLPQKNILPHPFLHHFETRYYESLSFDIHFERTFHASQLVSPAGDFEPAKHFS